ncbi:MAG: hypothetical protein ACODAJ_11295 [Planctomycetota bacterium]
MGRVETGDPDVIEYRYGGGCLVFFGLPFLLIGLFILASPLLPLAWRPKGKRSGEPVSSRVAVPLGGAFAVAGAVLVFGRGGRILDRRRDRLTTWWGPLVPLRRKERALGGFEKVQIAREERESKNTVRTVYPVRLAGAGAEPATIQTPDQREEAVALAEELAGFLGLPVGDGSMGSEVVRAPGEVDASLRDRARRTGERPEIGDPPAGARSTCHAEGDTLTLEIPPPALGGRHVVGLLLGLAAPVFVWVVFLRHGPGDGGLARWGALVVAVVPLLASWRAVLRSLRTRARVAASPSELRVTESGLVGSTPQVIAADELEELSLVPARKMERRHSLAGALAAGQVLVARAGDETAVFGAGVSREELEWMRAVIWNVLTA